MSDDFTIIDILATSSVFLIFIKEVFSLPVVDPLWFWGWFLLLTLLLKRWN